MNNFRNSVVRGAALIGFVLFAGCGQKDEVQDYRTDKSVAQTMPPAQTSMASEPNDGSAAPMMSPAMSLPAATPPTQKFLWDVPAEWKSLPASGMRVASFSFEAKDKSTLDISVVALSGPAGGLTANVNRWRKQIGLDELTDAELSSVVTPLQVPAGAVQTCAFSNPATGQGVAAGILSVGEETWFFKMSGAETGVTEGRPAFTKFLESLRKNP